MFYRHAPSIFLKLEPTYIESVGKLLHDNPSMVAASSWMHTFGILHAIVCPTGGNIVPFLCQLISKRTTPSLQG